MTQPWVIRNPRLGDIFHLLYTNTKLPLIFDEGIFTYQYGEKYHLLLDVKITSYWLLVKKTDIPCANCTRPCAPHCTSFNLALPAPSTSLSLLGERNLGLHIYTARDRGPA